MNIKDFWTLPNIIVDKSTQNTFISVGLRGLKYDLYKEDHSKKVIFSGNLGENIQTVVASENGRILLISPRQ